MNNREDGDHQIDRGHCTFILAEKDGGPDERNDDKHKVVADADEATDQVRPGLEGLATFHPRLKGADADQGPADMTNPHPYSTT